jgi:hypothetical protein
MAEKPALVGCPVHIYDSAGKLLLSSKITDHDRKNERVEIEGSVPGAKKGDVCRLYVATPPAPCEYTGRVFISGYESTIFAIYARKEKETREHERYPVKTKAVIESMVYAGKSYALHTPAEVLILNISKGGVKVRAPLGAMAIGNKFEIRLKIGERYELLLAEVMNAFDSENNSTDYGCRLSADKKPVRVV